LETNREFRLRLQWLKFCQIDSEDNWNKLTYHYSYYYINCYYLRYGEVGKDKGIYIGVSAFEDREMFLKGGAVDFN
jgi:hypothetical protein